MPIYGKGKDQLDRRKIYDIKSSNIESEAYRKKYQENKEKPETQFIHEDIIDLIKKGKGKVEILIFLNNKYPNTLKIGMKIIKN